MKELIFSGTARELYNVHELLEQGAIISKVTGSVIVADKKGKDSVLDLEDPHLAAAIKNAAAVRGVIPHEIRLTI